MPPPFVTSGEKSWALGAGGSSARISRDEPATTTTARRATPARLPMISQYGVLIFICHLGSGVNAAVPAGTAAGSLLRGRRAQGGVILAKDPILLSVVLMALVARGDSVLRHLRLERILVAEAEVGRVAGLVLEAL